MTSQITPRVTIVSCYNDRERYENELMKTLAEQDESYILLGINNTTNHFPSCSSAYNSVLNEIKTPLVIFAHQDILLTKSDTMRYFLDRLETLQSGDILGIAGVSVSDKQIVSSILHGKNRTHVNGNSHTIHELVECETIDECFFGCKTDAIRAQRFNEILCNNWHLYAVELSLRTRKEGNHVYICDTEMVHTSTGTISRGYIRNLFRLCEAYKMNYDTIYTTCSTCKTKLIPRCMYLAKREVALLIYR